MSIEVFPSFFLLSGKESSYLLEVDSNKRLVLDHFGSKIRKEEIPSFGLKVNNPSGSSLYLCEDNPNFTLDQEPLEATLPFGGNPSRPSLILKTEERASFSFLYDSYRLRKAQENLDFPSPYGDGEELIVCLKEERNDIRLLLHYLVYPKEDVIGRYIEIRNGGDGPLSILRLSSFSLLLNDEGYMLSTFGGAWANELHEERRKVPLGTTLLYSDSGASSNRLAPFFLLSKEESMESAYGFSFLYSGSFFAEIDRDISGRIRVHQGISDLLFEKTLPPFGSALSPISLMSYSPHGREGLSHNFHSFMRNHVLPKGNASKERPVFYNNWEATGMDFNENRIHRLMRKAKELGIEFFVLDDGWFGERKDDKRSLGDWYCNSKKLPSGLEGLSSYAKKLGLGFGTWMEPEMVSKESDLYRRHPDWIIKSTSGEPLLGRHQYVLDLTKKEVQEFIVASVSRVLSIPNLTYLKWDFNRPLGEVPGNNGAYMMDYMKGLYAVLKEIRRRFPNALLENCASGGNRFDYGMLRYFDQSWLSDCTDSFERIRIERSASYFFPLSALSNHVSSKINSQTMRKTSFENKFDVASFGVLGYELDLLDLSKVELSSIKKQIGFYKEHRFLLQFGDFFRLETFLDNDFRRESWEVLKEGKALVSTFYSVNNLNGEREYLSAKGLEDLALYRVRDREEALPISSFGYLVNYLSPIHLNEEGFALLALSKRKSLANEKFDQVVSGKLLSAKQLPLSERWKGTGLNGDTRVLFDFGTRVYTIEKIDSPNK